MEMPGRTASILETPILAIRDLKVDFSTGDGTVHAVKGVSLEVAKGETLAVVGESGSGKSQIMFATMGLLASNGRATGSVMLDGEEILAAPASRLNRIRGKRMTMIFQEPMTSLDPLYRIGQQLLLPLRHHGGLNGPQARARALELLRLVKIPEPERRLKAYPHELSGGQRQRVMIAMAIANNPDILIADEPTTALDVTVQAQILDLLAELQARLGMAIVFISHDLAIVRRFASRVAVMHAGLVVETGSVTEIFDHPKAEYTKKLLAAEPAGTKVATPEAAPVLLDASHVSVAFRLPRPFLKRRPPDFVAVNDVGMRVQAGETIGIVGESGSGKSTLGRALLGLVPAKGTVMFAGKTISGVSRAAMKPVRRDLGVVFQDPFGSLSPRMTVGEIITEGLLVHEPGITRRERDARAGEALTEVRLEPSARNRYPHEFSGGQRQRIAIARAMILKPKLMLLDEPTSALDRTVQRAIVDLLRDLQQRHRLTYLFISHDLAVVRALSDRILVMKDGVVVEEGSAEQIVSAPQQVYTQTLMRAAFGS